MEELMCNILSDQNCFLLALYCQSGVSAVVLGLFGALTPHSSYGGQCSTVCSIAREMFFS